MAASTHGAIEDWIWNSWIQAEGIQEKAIKVSFTWKTKGSRGWWTLSEVGCCEAPQKSYTD